MTRPQLRSLTTSKFYLLEKLCWVGVVVILSTMSCFGQLTETEAKHEKILKGTDPIEVKPRAFLKDSWCDWISNKPGTLLDKPDYRYIQSVVIYGNPHIQYSYISGKDADDHRFSGDEFLLRRFKLGVRVHYLHYFTTRIATDMRDDSGAQNSNAESSNYKLYNSDIIFDAQDAFNWESFQQFQFQLGYFKVPSNAGRTASSNAMRSIERSALSNYSSPTDSFGFLISTRKNAWDFDIGIFSSDDIDDGLTGDVGSFTFTHIGYLFGARHKFDSVRADLRLLINNSPGEGETFKQDWVLSTSTVMRKKHWRLMADFIVGENGEHFIREREGGYWGISVMPSLWLVENQLEAVFRYQYARAQEASGFQVSSHSIRRIAQQVGANINEGFGDAHQSLYAGMNYYICGDHTKIMAGVQWDDLSSENRQVYKGLTTWVAVRLYF